MIERTYSRVITLIGVIILICLSAYATGTVHADSLGSEAGFIFPTVYSVGKGGSVMMYIFASADAVIAGDDAVNMETGLLITGFAAGEYPDDENHKINVSKGHISLDRIDIIPAAGYIIDSVMIKEGVDGIWKFKDDITSYDFSDGANSFVVIFKPISSTSIFSSQPASLASVTSDTPLMDASGQNGSTDNGIAGSVRYPAQLLWIYAAFVLMLIFAAIIAYILKHKKIQGKISK
ncbi:MAG: hypothetical protein ACYCYM_05065 [Saccharofermentanales bacterium]